ncbi:MAG: hypothetical protein RLZZ234_370, partial [Candidatus Parcubacteria bacterium]
GYIKESPTGDSFILLVRNIHTQNSHCTQYRAVSCVEVGRVYVQSVTLAKVYINMVMRRVVRVG